MSPELRSGMVLDVTFMLDNDVFETVPMLLIWQEMTSDNPDGWKLIDFENCHAKECLTFDGNCSLVEDIQKDYSECSPEAIPIVEIAVRNGHVSELL